MDGDRRRGPERSRRLPREVRERQILDAAVRVFSEHGYHYASMDEISDVAGVSKPMIYAYLGAKEDLFTECIRREAIGLMEAISKGVRSELTPDMQLWHGLDAFFGYVDDHRESWLVLHRQATSAGGPFSRQLLEMRARAITLIDALLTKTASSEGMDSQARKGTEAHAAALVGACESLADWWLDHPDIPARVLATRAMNLVWMGFGDLMEGNVWTPTHPES
ncbi:TetR/AcrR family transcriptional regulator [Herbihabitans rhizosphaerae]|uniref:TetR/AcrR family transcriptional regulator n=1 Tax=Herbihabitans rhizosphaerae TaxID=1872711 RepID=UPI00102ABB59|nr:TetR/AcrR family transcriptional regulator [Herbihabitans rhizosphaerae]